MNRPFVNGNREQTNNFTVDGFDVNETIDNRVAYQPSPDALAEISVETNNYAADIGNVGGAVVSSVIKSGTNAFRGNAFEFYRNSDFDANTWENNRSGAAKQERKQHIYGGTLGGPIVPNTLFFFGDYQGSRQDAPGFGTASVAPEAWRRGDLSSVATAIRDPQDRPAVSRATRFRLRRISPTARALLNDLANYPLPNRTVPGGITGNFVGETLLAIRAHQGDARLDWNAVDQRQVLRAATRSPPTNDRRDKNPFPLLFSTRNDQPFYNVGVNWNRVFGPSVVNELLVGYSHTHVLSADRSTGPASATANAPYGIAGGQPIDGLTCIGSNVGCTAGLNGLSTLGAVAPDSDTLAKTYQINEKLTWLRGRHTIKVRRPVAALRPAALLRRQQRSARLHQLQRRVHRIRVRRLPARPGRRARAVAAAIPTIRGRTSRTAIGCSCRTTSRSRERLTLNLGLALGLHVAARREGQPADELRSGHRPADLRDRWQHRGPRALQALLQGLRAAARRRLDARRQAGWSAAATASRSSWRAPAPICGCR